MQHCQQYLARTSTRPPISSAQCPCQVSRLAFDSTFLQGETRVDRRYYYVSPSGSHREAGQAHADALIPHETSPGLNQVIDMVLVYIIQERPGKLSLWKGRKFISFEGVAQKTPKNSAWTRSTVRFTFKTYNFLLLKYI